MSFVARLFGKGSVNVQVVALQVSEPVENPNYPVFSCADQSRTNAALQEAQDRLLLSEHSPLEHALVQHMVERFAIADQTTLRNSSTSGE